MTMNYNHSLVSKSDMAVSIWVGNIFECVLLKKQEYAALANSIEEPRYVLLKVTRNACKTKGQMGVVTMVPA